MRGIKDCLGESFLPPFAKHTTAEVELNWIKNAITPLSRLITLPLSNVRPFVFIRQIFFL